MADVSHILTETQRAAGLRVRQDGELRILTRNNCQLDVFGKGVSDAAIRLCAHWWATRRGAIA